MGRADRQVSSGVYPKRRSRDCHQGVFSGRYRHHYNLIYREEEREMIPLCHDIGVALIPWSPLARGFLAGNRTPDDVSATLIKLSADETKRLGSAYKAHDVLGHT